MALCLYRLVNLGKIMSVFKKLALGISVFALLCATSAQAQLTKMTIATGVDPGFGAFYVAKAAGIFEKNGLDVQVNTGPSGSAMVAFVIQNQVQASFGAEQAGVQNFNIDNNVVVVADGTKLVSWFGLVARNVANIEGLKGKKIGVARGSGSEVFWLAIVEKHKLNLKDYTVVQVDAPEMVAALERGDIDAFTSWEPWLTRATMAIKNTTILVDSKGIMNPRVFIYLNKGWAEKNKPAALAFMRSMIEATKLMNTERAKAVDYISGFLKLDKDLTRNLMDKVEYKIVLDEGTLSNFVMVEKQLAESKKLTTAVDWNKFIYADLLKEIDPTMVNYTLPK